MAANAKIEDMGNLFKNKLTGSKDVKSALSGVIVSIHIYKCNSNKMYFLCLKIRAGFFCAGRNNLRVKTDNFKIILCMCFPSINYFWTKEVLTIRLFDFSVRQKFLNLN